MSTRGLVRILSLWLVALAGSLLLGAGGSVLAQQPPSEDQALYRELAERALGAGRGGGFQVIELGGAGPRLPRTFPRAELLPGALPSDLGYDLPLPPGSRLVGSVVYARGRFVVFDVVLDVPTGAGDVRQFYESTLTARGWTVSTPFPEVFPPPTGFVDDAILNAYEEIERELRNEVAPQFRHLCQGLAGPSIRVDVLADTGQLRDVRVSNGPPGICSSNAFDDPIAVPFPLLRLPSGSDLLSWEGSEEGIVFSRREDRIDLAATSATARSTATPADLESLFAAQLAGQGWQRQTGRSDDVAWSQWFLPGSTTVFGYLTVYSEPGQQLRVMRFQMRIADPQPPSIRPFEP